MLEIVHGLHSFLETGEVSCVALHPGVAPFAAESMGTTGFPSTGVEDDNELHGRQQFHHLLAACLEGCRLGRPGQLAIGGPQLRGDTIFAGRVAHPGRSCAMDRTRGNVRSWLPLNGKSPARQQSIAIAGIVQGGYHNES